jgi:hypothetical protein
LEEVIEECSPHMQKLWKPIEAFLMENASYFMSLLPQACLLCNGKHFLSASKTSNIFFLKLGLSHFYRWTITKHVVERTHYSSSYMYTSCKSYWTTFLVLPTYILEELIIKTSKIHNLFIHYPNNTNFNVLESSWKWEKNHKYLSF